MILKENEDMKRTDAFCRRGDESYSETVSRLMVSSRYVLGSIVLDVIKNPRLLFKYIPEALSDFAERLTVSRKYFLFSPFSYASPGALLSLIRLRAAASKGDTGRCLDVLKSVPEKNRLYPLLCFEAGRALMLAGDDSYIGYIDKAVRLEDSPPRLKYYIGTVSSSYRVSHLSEILKTFEDKKDKYHPYRIRWYHNFTGWVNLYRGKVKVPPRKENSAASSDKVMLLLHNSLGHNSGGYATRAHGLLKSLRRKGQEFRAYTRYAYPWDMIKGETMFCPGSVADSDTIEDITYHRIYGEGAMLNSELSIDQYLRLSAVHYEAEAEKNGAGLIHAASNFYTGLPALMAARRLGLPFIYEVRGLWEITRASRDKKWGDSEMYRLYSDMETLVAKEADHVFTITRALKNLLTERGVEAEKITVVPNGVEISKFEGCRERAGENIPVIGYIGSIVDYEGLELLIRASSAIYTKAKHKVLIVGDGRALCGVKALAGKLGTEHIEFTGRVPHEKIAEMYQQIDVAVYPRKGLPVCEIVSPIKPFEAMAMKKAVVVSDVAALKEFVTDGETGVIFRKDDAEDLAEKLISLITDKARMRMLGENARIWVQQERDWDRLTDSVVMVYRRLLRKVAE